MFLFGSDSKIDQTKSIIQCNRRFQRFSQFLVCFIHFSLFPFARSTSMHSLHLVESRLEKQLSTSEKRLSAPIYPDSVVITGEEMKSVEEENNLLSGDLERLNGRIPTVCGLPLMHAQSRMKQCGQLFIFANCSPHESVIFFFPSKIMRKI